MAPALFYKTPFQIHQLLWYLQLENSDTPPFPNPKRSGIKWKVLTFITETIKQGILLARDNVSPLQNGHVQANMFCITHLVARQKPDEILGPYEL